MHSTECAQTADAQQNIYLQCTSEHILHIDIYIYIHTYILYICVKCCMGYIGIYWCTTNECVYVYVDIYIAIFVMMMQLDKSGSIFLASSNDLSLSLSILSVYI